MLKQSPGSHPLQVRPLVLGSEPASARRLRRVGSLGRRCCCRRVDIVNLSRRGMTNATGSPPIASDARGTQTSQDMRAPNGRSALKDRGARW
jgi:hypothetical protein